MDLVHKERLRIILGKNNFTAPLDLLLFAVQALQPCQVLTRSQQLLGSGFVPEDSPVLFQKLVQFIFLSKNLRHTDFFVIWFFLLKSYLVKELRCFYFLLIMVVIKF